ncbi:hypothetical protein GHT06_018799 [Daphnia sinensis]|uniref:Uncharacterized protein n=1 Tax=Daphnia sinensis TaxID=1820382 RepID=A0AAD5L4U3_9CRUS|nr:hypothetical protein GHT06_018799 [Daphnia sinensis]
MRPDVSSIYTIGRVFKVLPRGGSCPTLPVGYMVGEGKEGVVQSNTSELGGLETMPKSYTASTRQPAEANGTMTSTLGRPRLETPTMNVVTDASGLPHHQMQQPQKHAAKRPAETATATGWRVKLWRKMTGGSTAGHSDYCQHHPYGADESDDISAVYAELNSVAGSTVHRPSPIYHLNTYSEIREPHHVMMPHPPHPQTSSSLAATLHLRRLLSDGTYENAGYALERGVMEHLDAVSNSNCSASTPSSAYYSDLSHSDRSGGSLHHQQLLQWPGAGQRPRPRVGSESHGSSHSLPAHQHCCHHHHCHHEHSRSLQEQQIRARDLMPIALQVIPDNQQTVPVLHYLAADDVSAASAAAHHHHQLLSFSRGGVSSSMRDDGSSGSCKRPLPPLPSRQQQRPQRRYAYAVDHQVANNSSSGHETPPQETAGGGESPSLSCVPSEYV